MNSYDDDYGHKIPARMKFLIGHFLEQVSTTKGSNIFCLLKKVTYFYKETVVYPYVEIKAGKKGLLLKSTDYMNIICHIEHRLCPFITFSVFKSGLATNNHIGLLIFPFYFQTRICYVFYALDRHYSLLVLTHCKLMTIKPQFFTNFN